MHKRETGGLKKHAQEKRQQALERTEEGIKQLIREQRPISFRSVADVSGVSRAWLYQQDDIRSRIEHLRNQQAKKKTVPPEQRASKSSSAAMVKTIKERVKKLQAENQELKQQLEVAYGRAIHAEDECDRYKRQVEALQKKLESYRAEVMPAVQPVLVGPQDDLIEAVESLGINMNATLARAIQGARPGDVEAAMAAFEQAVEAGTPIKHPGGWLKKAIEEAWVPNEKAQAEQASELEAFNKWFPKAKAAGLVVASQQKEDGSMVIYTPCGNCVSYSTFVATHPLADK